MYNIFRKLYCREIMRVEFMEEEEMAEMPVINVIPKVNKVTGWCGKKCDFDGQFEGRCVGSCPEGALKGTVLEYRQDGRITEEGYMLEILPEKILITSKTAAGKYFHIGGDEASKEEWEKCDHCQKLIR